MVQAKAAGLLAAALSIGLGLLLAGCEREVPTTDCSQSGFVYETDGNDTIEVPTCYIANNVSFGCCDANFPARCSREENYTVLYGVNISARCCAGGLESRCDDDEQERLQPV